MSSSSPNLSVYPVSYDANSTEVHLAGTPISQFAKKFGTPLYMIDKATLMGMIRSYQDAFSSYPGTSQILYASKANLCMGLCAIANQAGLGLDVVSGGEYTTALQSGFPVERILFNGNNKTADELELVIRHGIGKISVDNLYELQMLFEIAKRQNKTVDILLRVTPGIECHTHDYIKTGHIDSKFGFPLSQLSEALDLITKVYASHLSLVGLHAHIGSQIFETRPYADLAEVMLNLYYNIRQEYGLTLSVLNMGGGLGIAYQNTDDPVSVIDYASQVIHAVSNYCQKINFPLPHLLLEPGRSLIATAGCTLYTVGSIKTISAIHKTYVAVDGGMGDNIRPALYQAQYTSVIANKPQTPHTKTVTIVGKYCESGDVLIPNTLVPENIEPGDLLLVFGTGAYNYSMASNYNRVPRPAMILVDQNNTQTLVNRETYDDLLRLDCMPTL